MEPFRLRSNVIFFHDWRYVHHGDTGWVTEDGNWLGLWSSQPIPPLRWAGGHIPSGIRLRTIPPEVYKSIVVPDKPWEAIIFAPSLIEEKGVFRLWYESIPQVDLSSDRAGNRNLLCYAESRNGITWNKPSLGINAFDGSKDNNIVFGGDIRWGYHGSSVFVDPSCSPEERYKLVYLGFMGDEDYAKIREGRSNPVDPNTERGSNHCTIFGAVSPDGFHWESLPEPLVWQSSDTQNVAYYDEFLGKYVIYLRTWVLRRRAIGRTESGTFSSFPLPETIVWPGPDIGPSDLWYSNGRTAYPGAPDYHFMFAKRWKVAEDVFYTHLATSPDGIMWGFPPGSLVLSPGSDGWSAGGFDLGPGMVNLPDEKVGVPIIGWRLPHKHTRTMPLGEVGIARWERDRIVGLRADERGEFRTSYVIFEGEVLYLNFRTDPVGEIKIGVLSKGKYLEGRSPEDCDPIYGDSSNWAVTWNGDNEIARGPDDAVAFKIKMDHAEIFSMRFGS
ncbi:MAG: hypothetical protein HXS50_03780 [Theionarchaea archaeon]|nr:hypothetical protein [Theionarchaea archaeon]